MTASLYRLVRANRVILSNASSMVSTTFATSVLGFAYWWVAARLFPPTGVGVASAAISAMMLLGAMGALGLGTLLISELSRQPKQAVPLIMTALIVVSIAGGVLGTLFALGAPILSPDLALMAEHPLNVMLFALGVSLTSTTIVVDQAIIGLLSGELQLWRNILFATAKLVILGIVGLWLHTHTGMSIYATWVAGSIISLLFLLVVVMRQRQPQHTYRPEWGLLRKLGWSAVGHHALNVALQSPRQLLPLIVTALLSATTNAYFYAALMIVNFIYTVPMSLTTVLHAIGAADREVLARKLRYTFGLSLLGGVIANLGLLLGAPLVLGIFGQVYAEEATGSLWVLGMGVFPLIVRYHYVSIMRIYDQMARASSFIALGGILELALAIAGGIFGGLTWLSLGWVIALCVEALLMARIVYRVARPPKPPGDIRQTQI